MNHADVHAQMLTYFAAEKREAAVFLAAGVVAVAVAFVLFRGAGPYRGMIAPLAIVGAIQIVVGGSVFFRTDGQVSALEARFREAPAAVRAEETPRMDRVMAAFRLYKAIEIAVLAAGIALALAFPYRSTWHAVGIGCIAQGALMLVLDLFAEGRGYDYLAALARLPST